MPSYIKSSPDKIRFTEEVWKKFVSVVGLMKRKNHLVIIPMGIQDSAKQARRIALRHNRGDYRHTEYEMMHEQEVARWLVEKWAELHGHPTPAIKFGPHH